MLPTSGAPRGVGPLIRPCNGKPSGQRRLGLIGSYRRGPFGSIWVELLSIWQAGDIGLTRSRRDRSRASLKNGGIFGTIAKGPGHLPLSGWRPHSEGDGCPERPSPPSVRTISSMPPPGPAAPAGEHHEARTHPQGAQSNGPLLGQGGTCEGDRRSCARRDAGAAATLSSRGSSVRPAKLSAPPSRASERCW